jgi:hypothetical protein
MIDVATAVQIRDEETKGANTAERVGGLFVDLVNAVNKYNVAVYVVEKGVGVDSFDAFKVPESSTYDDNLTFNGTNSGIEFYDAEGGELPVGTTIIASGSVRTTQGKLVIAQAALPTEDVGQINYWLAEHSNGDVNLVNVGETPTFSQTVLIILPVSNA